MKKYILILIILATIVIWLTRYSIYVSGAPCAYKLDRWTGKVTFLVQYTEHQIEQYERPKTYEQIAPPPPDIFDKIVPK